MGLIHRVVLELGKPILGICLGSQIVAAVLGGKVRAAEAPEIGFPFGSSGRRVTTGSFMTCRRHL